MPLREDQIRNLAWLGLAGLIAWALYSLAPVLTPFALAWVFAYVLQPLVSRLSQRGVPRSLAVALVMFFEALALVLLLLTVLPLFVKEVAQLTRELPRLLDRMNETAAPWILARTGIAIALDSGSITDWLIAMVQGGDGLGMRVLDSLRLGSLGLLGAFATAVLVPVVQFYLMRDWELMMGRLEILVPRPWHQHCRAFMDEADAALGQYLHGQILVIVVMCIFYIAGLWLTGLEFFLPIGVITGVLVFVPYVGAATGFILGTLAAGLQFQGWSGLIWVWLVFVAGQAIEGNVITPKLVGERIGLHPVAVIFALLAFGQVFGFVGLLIALPASAVLLVALRNLRAQYLASTFYSGPR